MSEVDEHDALANVELDELHNKTTVRPQIDSLDVLTLDMNITMTSQIVGSLRLQVVISAPLVLSPDSSCFHRKEKGGYILKGESLTCVALHGHGAYYPTRSSNEKGYHFVH